MAKILVLANNGEVIDKIQIPAEFEYSPVMKEYYALLIKTDIEHALRLDQQHNHAREIAREIFEIQREEEPTK